MTTIEEFEAMDDVQINRKIAELSGYEVVTYPWSPNKFTLTCNGQYALRDGDSEEEAWKGLPRWTDEPGMALDLFRENYLEISHTPTGGWYIRVAERLDHHSYDMCRSLCVLWLTLQEMAKAKIVSM